MKKITFFLAVFATLFVVSASAQFIDKATLPAPVSQSFTTSYSSVSASDWEKLGGKYKVTFKVDTVSHEITYDEAGAVITNQYSIASSALPKEVLNGVAKRYPEFTVAAADKVEEDGKIKYLVTVTGGENPLKILTTDKGVVIKTTVSENAQ